MNPWRRVVGRRAVVARLVVAVAVAMTVVLALSSAFVFWRVSFALDRQVDQDLDAYRQVVVRAVGAGQRPPTDTPGQTFQVYDDQGHQVGGSRKVAPLLDAGDGDTLQDVRSGLTHYDVGSLVPPAAHPYRVQALTVRAPEGNRLVVAAISRRKHDEALRELLLQLVIADLAVLLAASFVGYRTARAALDPVERYRRAAEDARAVHPGRRLPVGDRDDELARLGHTFNDLLDRLEAGVERERRFLADASHELRTPLSLMRTELEWALHRQRSEAETTTVLRSVQDQVHRLVELANALLDLEELRASDTFARDRVALPVLLREAVGTQAAEVDAPDVPVLVNRRWVELAVANLVANAHRHGRAPVCVEGRLDAGTLRVVVRDEGEGFPPGFAEKAFERFSRAESSRTTPGSGLGLALVRAVAEAHGGTAHADPGPGGAVVVTLPGAGSSS